MKKGCFCFIRGEWVVFKKVIFSFVVVVFIIFFVILLYMIKNNDWPVLEFDDDKDAVVNPFKWNLEKFDTDHITLIKII